MRLLSRHSSAGLAALLLASLPGMPAVPGVPLVPGAAGQQVAAGSSRATAAGAAQLASNAPGAAGNTSPPTFPGGLPVGSEAERYLRVLQVAGLTGPHPWSLRGFSPREMGQILPSAAVRHPWEEGWARSGAIQRPKWVGWVEPEVGVLFNSTIPSGENDGPLWAGKGFTTVVRGGVWTRLGPLHLRLAPEVFWTENASFRTTATGGTGDAALRDPRFPTQIDLPQRFGGGEYTRLDPGSSALHLELPLLTLGASGAAQWWGPSLHHPLMVGNNAGGFRHAFVQTGGPMNLGLAGLHARVLGGRLDQSPYSPVQEGETSRFLTGALLVLNPRGLPGLELGAHRMTGRVWPEGGIGWAEVERPFRDIVRARREEGGPGEAIDLAGAFLRWVFPGAGFEMYGEILREDIPRSLRHFLEKPDHRMARVFGFQRVWTPAGGSLVALRGEVVSAELHHSERGDRSHDEQTAPLPIPPYIHGVVRQGHTQNGQLLGSPAAYGGAGWTLGVDHYHRKGRWSVDISRAVRLDWLPAMSGPSAAGRAEVGYTVKLEGVWFWGGVEWGAVAAPSWHLNRDLVRGRDLFNLKLELWGRGLPR